MKWIVRYYHEKAGTSDVGYADGDTPEEASAAFLRQCVQPRLITIEAVERTRTAWDLIGWDDGYVRIAGGDALYETVSYNDETGGTRVRLERIDQVKTDDGWKLRVIKRYVDPDTPMEPVGDMARENWIKEIDDREETP